MDHTVSPVQGSNPPLHVDKVEIDCVPQFDLERHVPWMHKQLQVPRIGSSDSQTSRTLLPRLERTTNQIHVGRHLAPHGTTQ